MLWTAQSPRLVFSALAIDVHAYLSSKEANTTAVLEDLQIEPGPVETSLKRGIVSFEGTLAAPPKRSRRMSIDEVSENADPTQAFATQSALPGDFVANLDFVADFS